MRPTELNFRSPKQRTPAPYYPLKTHLGDSLIDSPKVSNGTFYRSKRFIQYDQDKAKTGTKVGPGTYKQDPSRNIGVHLYKLGYNDKNCYSYFGNHLVYDPDSTFNFRLKSSLRQSKLGSSSKRIAKTRGFYSAGKIRMKPFKTNHILRRHEIPLDKEMKKYLSDANKEADNLLQRIHKEK